jgi:hypothetical protein
MLSRDPSKTYDEHELTVRHLLGAIEGELVLRCLYDSAVDELQRTREKLHARG